MNKPLMHSKDMTADNVSKVAALFPNCVTEHKDAAGNIVQGIDFEKLHQELSSDLIQTGEERYQFTWPGKMAAIREANRPTNCALRPDLDSSEDFLNTKNLYIEGDNLEVLKLLQENYLGKVKVIYIDPPYNTGNDFVYNDDFAVSAADFADKSGMFDDDGNMLLQNFEKNAESNGRFHTDWLNMMYPRLKVARNLLTEDGVIFISIDDHEAENLKKMCSEIFGQQNFIAQVVWERAFAPINLKKHFSISHDYIVAFSRDINLTICNGLARTEEANSRYSNPDNDPRGVWTSDNSTVGPAIPDKVYPLTTPSGNVVYPPSGRCWLYTQKRFQEMIEDNRIWFGTTGNNVPRVKRFLSEVKQGVTPMSIWKYSEVGHSQEASQKLKKLFGNKDYFDYPKPVELIKRCIELYSDKDSIVLDFFSGSSTTAQAVIELNNNDEGKRTFIMVQLPEETDSKSEANNDGYKTICDIAKKRISLAGKIIKEDSPLTTQHLDTGFRVLKLDSSNMKDIYYTPKDTQNVDLFDTVSNIKMDRTPMDLLFQVMLEKDIPLSAKIEQKEMADKTVFFVEDNYLVATFDDDITEDLVKEIAKMQPYNFVMANTGFATDSLVDNFEQIFKAYSPETACDIL